MSKSIEEYNYPSIEHNGEQWIRMVDHLALSKRDAQQQVQEAVEAVEKIRIKPCETSLCCEHWDECCSLYHRESVIDDVLSILKSKGLEDKKEA